MLIFFFRFAQICQALIESGIGASDFASFFLPRLAPLAYDPVVNVRIAASRTIGTIYTNGKLIGFCFILLRLYM